MPAPSFPVNNGHPKAHFTQTRWSVVLAAGRSAESDSSVALGWLCERYWFPLFAHARARGSSTQEAEDLVQSFFARVLSENILLGADAERGRFRAFLLGCFNHFLSHERRSGQRLKRGGISEFIELDAAAAEVQLQSELVEARTPALDFDRAWALTLLDRVLAILRAECDGDGKLGRFEVIQKFIQGERSEMPLAAAAAELGISLPAIKSIVHRLRQRFRELVLHEVRQTVECEDQVPAELAHLFAALRK